LNITPGYFELTEDQREFKELLDQFPRLISYWDFNKRECDLERLKSDMSALSTGEAIVARFLVGVWLGENQLNFDIFDASKSLDSESYQRIVAWLNNPFFP